MACVSSAAARAVALAGLGLVLVVAMAMADGPPPARTTFPAPQMHGYRLANPKEVSRFELSYGAVADHVIELTVVLTPAPGAREWLEATFEDVSNPRSPNYQAYLTTEAIQTRMAVPMSTAGPVLSWFESAGPEVAPTNHGDYLTVQLPVRAAASLFNTTMAAVVSLGTGRVEIRGTGPWSLPSEIAPHVRLVAGLNNYVNKVRLGHKKPVGIPKPSNSVVVPLTIHNLYDIAFTIEGDENAVGCVEFSDNSYAADDLHSFCTGAGVPYPPKITNVGPYKPNPSDGESTLDVQCDTSVAQGGNLIFWSSEGWLLQAANQWLNAENCSLVNSISWATDEKQQGKTYNNEVDAVYQKLGVRGITVVASSGDNGASFGSSCDTLATAYPGASPAVLSAGATMIIQDNAAAGDASTPPSAAGATLPPVCSGHGYQCSTGVGAVESVADEPQGGYASGGGFSAFVARPSWQDAAVAGYFNNSAIPLPPSGKYNAANRGFPDVSANGNNILMFEKDWQLSGGTSAAAPYVASMIALLNDHLLGMGKEPLGFVNPLIYQIWAEGPTTYFHQVGGLDSNNKDGCTDGWVSNPAGWSPSTGVGTFNLSAIVSYIDDNADMFRDRVQD